MDKTYADTVRLLLAVTPAVFNNDIFAMKGGTAINLFVQDMPRLSVDIDVAYRPWQKKRDQALQAITDELATISQRLEPLGVQTRLTRSKDLADTKLIAENAYSNSLSSSAMCGLSAGISLSTACRACWLPLWVFSIRLRINCFCSALSLASLRMLAMPC
ncbi:nucleotidyltransferase AbiEii toxin of type IV toxin-antitoxin system [Paracandidimonas soli]|uniref:Nucleotidyltransferase AbiEii toxin of type IV toxin-antitoxin system n=1 Tax=Paracandidimonas soli TaxID=1917182 RepID=A0A4R3UWZ8_9BURK|nr:nucleotidyltransferase AbiEii toxin of type IV toxin-antitoxin system [Paracandidimonas soli]